MTTTEFGDPVEGSSATTGTTEFGDPVHAPSDTPRVEVKGTSADEPGGERASIYKALETLGTPFANFSERTADAIRHPGDTASNIGAGALGGLANLGNIVAALPMSVYNDVPLGEQYKSNARQINAVVEPLAADPNSMAYRLSSATPGAVALSPLGAVGGMTGFGLDVAGNAGLSAAEAYGEGSRPRPGSRLGRWRLSAWPDHRPPRRGAPTTDSARELLRGGVVPTPGGAGGPLVRAAENAATVVPGAGDVVNYSRASAIRQAARAEINRATAPVGTTVDRSGAGAVDEANRAVSGAYDTAKQTASLDANAAGQAVAQSINGWGSIPGIGNREQAWLAQFVKNEVWPVVQAAHAAGRPITGAEFKAMDSAIGEQAHKFATAADPMRQPVGAALYDLKQKLFAQVQGPGAQGLRNADQAFSAMRPVTAAADRAPGGAFSPQQLHRQGVNSPFNTAAREMPTPSGGLTDNLRNMGSMAALFTGHGMAAATAAAAAGALYSKPGVNLILNGIPSLPFYVAHRLRGLPPAQAMSEIADLAARYPQIGNAVSATLSRYAADHAARSRQTEMQ